MAFATLEMMQAYEAQVNNKFAVLNDQVQAALAGALEAIDAKVGEKFDEANTAFQAERARVEEVIRATAETVQSLTSGNVQNLTDQIAGINAREETFKDLLSGLPTKTA